MKKSLKTIDIPANLKSIQVSTKSIEVLTQEKTNLNKILQATIKDIQEQVKAFKAEKGSTKADIDAFNERLEDSKDLKKDISYQISKITNEIKKVKLAYDDQFKVIKKGFEIKTEMLENYITENQSTFSKTKDEALLILQSLTGSHVHSKEQERKMFNKRTERFKEINQMIKNREDLAKERSGIFDVMSKSKDVAQAEELESKIFIIDNQIDKIDQTLAETLSGKSSQEYNMYTKKIEKVKKLREIAQKRNNIKAKMKNKAKHKSSQSKEFLGIIKNELKYTRHFGELPLVLGIGVTKASWNLGKNLAKNIFSRETKNNNLLQKIEEEKVKCELYYHSYMSAGFRISRGYYYKELVKSYKSGKKIIKTYINYNKKTFKADDIKEAEELILGSWDNLIKKGQALLNKKKAKAVKEIKIHVKAEENKIQKETVKANKSKENKVQNIGESVKNNSVKETKAENANSFISEGKLQAFSTAGEVAKGAEESEGMMTLMMGVLSAFLSAYEIAKNAIKNGISAIAKALSKAVAKVWSAVRDGLKSIGETISKFFKGLTKGGEKAGAEAIAKSAVGESLAAASAKASATMAPEAEKALGMMSKLKGIPILGPLLVSSIGGFEIYQAIQDRNENKISGQVMDEKIGASLGSILGTLAGGELGAIIGSILPGAGTFMGGLAGAALGGYAGEWAGKKIVDYYLGSNTGDIPTPAVNLSNRPQPSQLPSTAGAYQPATRGGGYAGGNSTPNILDRIKEQSKKAISSVGKFFGFQLSSGVDWENVRPEVRTRAEAMFKEYKRETGKDIRVNSGYRSYEKQLALFNKYGPGRAARPGSSPHEYGLAFDLNTSDANDLDKLGLLKQFGFSRPALKSMGEAWHIELDNKGATRRAMKEGGGINVYKEGTTFDSPNLQLSEAQLASDGVTQTQLNKQVQQVKKSQQVTKSVGNQLLAKNISVQDKGFINLQNNTKSIKPVHQNIINNQVQPQITKKDQGEITLNSFTSNPDHLYAILRKN